MIKTIIYETESGPVAALVRGDHAVNEAKLKKVLGVEDLRLAGEKIIEKLTGAPVGFAGPVGLKGIKILADTAIPAIDQGITGANKQDYHLLNVNYGRDYKADLVGDIRYANRSDKCPRCGQGKFEVQRGIEVGHIFKLGTKYSSKMNCLYLDEKNTEKTAIMGCYGIGIGRTAAAAIEQNHDQAGIIWPIPLAPFLAAMVPINAAEKEQLAVAEKLYAEAQAAGLEVLFDDRDQRIGAKLADLDLMGIPFKVIIGPKGLKDGKVEIKSRRSGETEFFEIDKAVGWLKQSASN